MAVHIQLGRLPADQLFAAIPKQAEETLIHINEASVRQARDVQRGRTGAERFGEAFFTLPPRRLRLPTFRVQATEEIRILPDQASEDENVGGCKERRSKRGCV